MCSVSNEMETMCDPENSYTSVGFLGFLGFLQS